LLAARRIGVFGGTFDPVHHGHLVCAEQIREEVGLDIVMFVPCNRQPHKPRYVPAPAVDRLAMLRAATRKHPAFVVSDIETRRGGTSFSSDTILELRSLLGPGPELWLMLGMDAFLDLEKWKNPEVLIRECRFAVATRPGFDKAGRAGGAPARALRRRCRFVGITALDISSRSIRGRVARGKSIRFLVPEAVEAHIRRKGLYS